MISLDRALWVLLLGVLVQALLQLRRGGAAPVWRSNVAAELALAETLLRSQPDEAEPLVLAAFQALHERKILVEGQMADYEAKAWFQQALYDTSRFQAHADWLKMWRQEWAEKLNPKGDRAPPSIPSPRVATKLENAGGNGGLRSAVEVAQDAIKNANGDWKAAGMDAVLEEVIHLMDAEPDNAFVQERSCESLRYMAVDDVSRTAVGESLSAILRAMALNENASEVQGYCCGTLVHLAAGPATRQAIIEKEGVEAILRAMQLHPSNSFVHFKACAALANLASTSVEQKLLMMKGTGKELLQSMKTHLHDLSVLEYCLGALHNLATYSGNQAALRTIGAVKTLRDAVRLYPQNSEVQRIGSKTIKLLKPRGGTEKAAAVPSGEREPVELDLQAV